MIIERIIFNVVAFALFVIIFLKMIYRNDTNYTYILATQAIRNSDKFYRSYI